MIQPVALLGWVTACRWGGLLARHWKHSVERVDSELSSVRAVSGMRPPAHAPSAGSIRIEVAKPTASSEWRFGPLGGFFLQPRNLGRSRQTHGRLIPSKALNNMKDALACCVVSFRGSWTCLRA